MSFQSYTFLFALLPVSVAGWWLLNWRGHGLSPPFAGEYSV